MRNHGRLSRLDKVAAKISLKALSQGVRVVCLLKPTAEFPAGTKRLTYGRRVEERYFDMERSAEPTGKGKPIPTPGNVKLLVGHNLFDLV